MKHKKDWPGDKVLSDMGTGTVEEEEDQDKKWAERETTFDKNVIAPNDPFDALRQILHNNGCDKWREATISLFQNYSPEDYEGLEQIMADQHIPPVKRNMVMKTYRAMMGAPEEVEEEEQPVKGKKPAQMMNPMDVGPEQIMMMSPGEMMRWKQSLMVYKQAMETFNGAMKDVYGGMPGSQQGQYPPEVQAILTKFKEMEEREKMQQVFGPMLQRLQGIEEKLKQTGGGGGSDFKDIYEKVMTMKMLDSLGNDKQVEGLRKEAEERMERIRSEREQAAQAANREIETLKNQTVQMQFNTLQQTLGGQIAGLNQKLLENKDAPGSMAKILDDYMALQQRVKQFTTGEAPKTEGEKKTEMVVGLLGDVAKTFQPTIQTAVNAMTQKGANQSRPNAPARSPVRNVQQPPVQSPMQEEATVQEFQCTFCGAPIQYVGNPSSLTCPACGQLFSNDATEARAPPTQPMTPTEQSRREPTEEELRTALIQQPRAALDTIARKQGIDPTAYSSNEELVDYLVRMRK